MLLAGPLIRLVPVPVKHSIPLARAIALQFSSRHCSPPHDLALRKPTLPSREPSSPEEYSFCRHRYDLHQGTGSLAHSSAATTPSAFSGHLGSVLEVVTGGCKWGCSFRLWMAICTPVYAPFPPSLTTLLTPSRPQAAQWARTQTTGR